jgi:hypothetical protein
MMLRVSYIRDDFAAAWIAEIYDLDLDQVAAVLGVEFEYMVATGIAVRGPDTPEWDFRYYAPGDLDGEPASLDPLRIAHDAERLAGVPADVGLRALQGELEFFRRHGVA